MTEYTPAEVAKHASKNDCWLSIDGFVYDVTQFLDDHPGGYDIVLEEAGRDATDAFNDIGHSDDARITLESYKIGVLKGASAYGKEKSHKSTPSKSLKQVPKAGIETWIARLVLLILLYLFKVFVYDSNNSVVDAVAEN